MMEAVEKKEKLPFKDIIPRPGQWLAGIGQSEGAFTGIIEKLLSPTYGPCHLPFAREKDAGGGGIFSILCPTSAKAAGMRPGAAIMMLCA